MITIISGTNRKNAVSKKVALQYQQLLQEYEVESNIIDLALLPPDFLETALYENQGKNEGFNKLSDLMKLTEKYVFIVPEYNGSFPGILKAFLDGLEFPGTLKGKKCAMVGISAGVQGAALAMSHLTDIFNYLGMHVFAGKPKLMRIGDTLVNGKVEDDSYIKRLREQAEQFLEF